MKKFLKSVLSLFLVCAMIFPLLSLTVSAAKDANLDSNYSINDDGAIGSIFKNSISASADSNAYTISSVNLTNEGYVIKLNNAEACTLVFAAFDESTKKMLTSVVTKVEANAGTATVQVPNLVDHYYVEVYLLDAIGASLCEKFTCVKFTAAYEDFLDKTPADFSGDTVIAFDEKDEDFAVLNKSVKTITKSSDMTVEKNGDTYTFVNANSDIKNLKDGESFYYSYGDDYTDIYIIKVDSISKNGENVTIVADDDLNVEEAFTFLRVNGFGNLDEEEAEQIEYGEIFTPLKNTKSSQSMEASGKTADDFEYNNEKSIEKSCAIEYKPNDNVSIKGSLTFNLEAHVEAIYDVVLFGKDYFWFNFNLKTSAKLSVKVEGKIEIPEDYSKIKIPAFEVAVFTVNITLRAIAEVSATIEFSVEVSNEIEFRYDRENGARQTKDGDTEFEPNINSKIVIKIGIGIGVELEGIKILKVSCEASVAVEVAATMLDIQDLIDVHHLCTYCVDGSIDLVIGCEFKCEVGISKLWSYKKTLAKLESRIKLHDFYVSCMNGKWTLGYGNCVNKEYLVEFIVKEMDSNNQLLPIKGAVCSCSTSGVSGGDDANGVTDEYGVAKLYFKSGRHTITISKSDYVTETMNITINNKSDRLNATLTPINSSNPTNPSDPTNSGSVGTNAKWSYSATTKTLSITGTGEMKDFGYYTDTPWISYIDVIEAITVSDGITGIGNYAFAGMRALKSFVFADSVTSIGNSAFYGSSGLAKISINASIKTIDDYAFYDCYGVTSLTINQGVNTIGDYAFGQCTGIENVIIPASVSSIGEGAFAWCNALETVTIYNSNCAIYSSETTIYNGATICGVSGSTANSYATKYNRTFKNVSVKSTASVTTDATGLIPTGIYSVSKTGGVVGSYYTLLVLKKGKTLSADNLLYIGQTIADSTGKVSFEFYPKTAESSDVFIIGSFSSGVIANDVTSSVLPYANSVTLTIATPSTKSLNYGDSLIIHASSQDLPDGAKIVWSVDNGVVNGQTSSKTCQIHSEGCSTYTITSANSGTATITASVVGADNTTIVSDTIQINSNAGFFQKLISFFKNLFGAIRTVPQAFKEF